MVEPIPVQIKSTTGAGDGALAVAIEKGCSIEELIPLSIASSCASIMKNGTEMGKISKV